MVSCFTVEGSEFNFSSAMISGARNSEVVASGDNYLTVEVFIRTYSTVISSEVSCSLAETSDVYYSAVVACEVGNGL